MAMPNAIRLANALGHSFWYDTLDRRLLTSGDLQALVERDGLSGVTSNPTIFEKAIDGSADYDAQLQELVASGLSDPKALYEQLVLSDIRAAADVLHPVYRETGGADGYVSLEVSPALAGDTRATVEEGRRLFSAVARDNVMIKVPGTPAGMPAIERLTAEGINVNVTLLFSLDAYRACAEAYLAGLEQLVRSGGEPARVLGVASFFLSRIDAAVEERLAAPERRGDLEVVRGRVAVANAKLAHAQFRNLVASNRWTALAARGARPQRLLWASTGPKNPLYPRTMYIDPLIGPDTISTVLPETFAAFRDQGQPRITVTEGLAEARVVLATLERSGISLEEVTAALLTSGVAAFTRSLDKLLATLERKRRELS
jgi:transaldolase